MSNVLVLGAGDQIARWAIAMLSDELDVKLTLFLRHPKKLGSNVPANARVVQGDVLQREQLDRVMSGQDIIYANLTGDDIDKQAKNIVDSMRTVKVQRLIFVASLGIYDEVPGKFGVWNRRMIGSYLPPFRKAADLIESSGFDYMILRPAWLTDHNEVNYETTGRDEPFKGTEVSRKSVAALIVEGIRNPKRFPQCNLGVNKPNTDGDKPSFY
jgi:uncharacterized protein YbjT (DUF2867 family)